MHHSARNDQFAFNTCLLAPETDKSSFDTGCAYYGQLITVAFDRNYPIFIAAKHLPLCIVKEIIVL